ncbi:MAG: CoB--CoM heterodisulfide reductase iron-sulfur subunit A family protein [Deltaproteobacteria bacterium]|nr:CoB--CoM heterodisulfide reductase iron-sulfur subunit A family protein [Deltaproteobacteria bacterium]
MSELKIGVYVCNCGTNIAKTVDCDAVVQAVQALPGVAVAKSYKYMCSNPGQEMIDKDIKELGLNRVVVAACSPRMHEPTFRKALDSAGLNPYYLEMANIREQNSWVHEDGAACTQKAIDLARAAVRRVALHEPLEKRSVPMCTSVLVLGGGVTGLTAALELADANQSVFLVERDDHLGGNVARIDLTAPHLDSARDLLRDRIARVTTHPKIKVLLGSELVGLSGYIGNFKPLVRVGGQEQELEVGAVVVCTGYQEFDAKKVKNLGYGSLPDVVTSFDLERMLRAGRIATRAGKAPRYVSLIHCVGSRSEEHHPYCSRVCCMTALKYAHEIKSMLPDAYVSDLYIDMHAFGKGCEDFYKSGAELHTMFLMYRKNQPPQVRLADPKDGFGMLIALQEQLSGESIEIPADLVVLMVGMEPRADAAEVAHLVNISRDKDGWFIESHPKLDPVATTTDGIFIAGACQAPKDIPDSVAQARAASARILAKIAQGKIWVDAVYAEIDEERCCGCRMCGEVCPYSAIEYNPATRRSTVVSVLCKACGTCAATCPAGAIKARHFSDRQIFAQIAGLLEGQGGGLTKGAK